MYTKAKIFNLALGKLLLSRQVIDPDTDQSNEAKVLLRNWDSALRQTLIDLDLDSTSFHSSLELLSDDQDVIPNGWLYCYKYPSDCVFFRKINSLKQVDTRDTFIPKQITTMVIEETWYKVILTNEPEAVADYIPKDVPLTTLAAPVGMAIASRLAYLSAPLIVGKGAKSLRESIMVDYRMEKAEAQEQDALEGFNFSTDEEESEFVRARVE